MSRLDKAKKVIKKHYDDGDCGIFNTRNYFGDAMDTIYDDGELTIDICYHWSYFEVFGLTDTEFQDLRRFYRGLGRK